METSLFCYRFLNFINGKFEIHSVVADHENAHEVTKDIECGIVLKTVKVKPHDDILCWELLEIDVDISGI